VNDLLKIILHVMRALTQLIFLFCLAASLCSAQSSDAVVHGKGEFLNLLGHKIWYESSGQGGPLLLIPGAGGAHDYFHPFFAPLERSFRVIYFDAFGRGNSEHAKSPAEYTFEHDIDEIEALRQALHLGRIMVYGHSYGGFVAQGYALKYPDSVSKVIVSNIFLSGEDFQISNEQFNDQLKAYFPELWAQIVQLRARGFVSSSPELQQVTGPYFLPTLVEMFYFYDPQNAKAILPFWNEHNFSAEQWNAVAGPDADFKVGGDLGKLDLRPRLSSIKVPIMIVAGRHDGIVSMANCYFSPSHMACNIVACLLLIPNALLILARHNSEKLMADRCQRTVGPAAVHLASVVLEALKKFAYSFVSPVQLRLTRTNRASQNSGDLFMLVALHVMENERCFVALG
jgi:proline iminopeptidase